jgi:hypothetical protein
MRKAINFARTSALPAIAAVLALSSTHVLAQEAPAQPPPATAPAVSAAPAPTLDPAPVPSDATVSPDITTVPESKVTRTTRTATATRPAVATRHKVTQTVTRTTRAAIPASAAARVAAAPAKPAAVATGPTIQPVVDLNAVPAKPATTADAKPANRASDTALEIGGGALALAALGAGAWALSRRRRREDEVVYDEAYEPEAVAAAEPEPEAMPRHDPILDQQQAPVAQEASAFAWGNRAPAEQAEDDGSDRRRGETWVERAYRGPSPANPSVSLKNRLRRAAFFDKREREVAAGEAEPVEADAGLPDAMTEEQERELA